MILYFYLLLIIETNPPSVSDAWEVEKKKDFIVLADLLTLYLATSETLYDARCA